MHPLKKLHGVYYVRLRTSGKTKYLSTQCTNQQDARRVLKQSGLKHLQAAAKAGRLTQKALGQILTGRNLNCLKALEQYRRLKSASLAPKTVANTLLVVRNWLREAGIETLPPAAVKPEHIARWINRPTLTWKRSTRQLALAGVRAFFGFCAEQGWIAADPSRLVELDYSVMTHQQKESPARQPFTEDELKRLVGELEKQGDSFWLAAVSLARETGLRLSGIAQLEWRCFVQPGKLRVWTDKTNTRIEHTISPGLQHLIASLPVNDAECLFPEQRAVIRDVNRRARLSMQFGRLCRRLGFQGRSFHSLRHYQATAAFARLDQEKLARKLAESLSLDQIASLLGHANKNTTKGYLH